jgi:hypothetical protein
MIIYGSDHAPLMEVESFYKEGGTLRFDGKIMGAMPVTAVVTPSQMRKLVFSLGIKMILFSITLFFRKDPEEFS